MSFPKQFLGFPIGWRKLGSAEEWIIGGILSNNYVHHCANEIWGKNLCLGESDGVPFLYCPKCLVKIKEIKS